MKKVLIMNGPNLNLLGEREPDHYGKDTLESVQKRIATYAAKRGVETLFFQSNSEGGLIDPVTSGAAGSGWRSTECGRIYPLFLCAAGRNCGSAAAGGGGTFVQYSCTGRIPAYFGAGAGL